MASATYPPVPDVARVELHTTWGVGAGLANQVAVNGFYIQNTLTARDEAYLQTLADAAEAAYDDFLDATQNNGGGLTLVRVIDLDTTLHPTFDKVISPTIAGTVAGELIPLSVCAVVRLVGDFGVAPKRSYVRAPALSESQVTGNRLSTGVAATMTTAYAAAVAAMAPAVADANVIVSVYEPGMSGTSTPFRDTGIANGIASVTVRDPLGRSVSRID